MKRGNDLSSGQTDLALLLNFLETEEGPTLSKSQRGGQRKVSRSTPIYPITHHIVMHSKR